MDEKDTKGLDELYFIIDNESCENDRFDNDALPTSNQEKKWEEIHIEKIKRYKADTNLRGKLAVSTMVLIYIWMAAVMVILMLNTFVFRLESQVLITVLGTTTATVLGLALIVLNGFFKVMKQDVNFENK